MIERIVFDWKRTLYNPDNGLLLPGANLVVSSLAEKGFSMVLIGKGGSDMEEAVNQLEVRQFFNDVRFVSSKSNKLFEEYIDSENPELTLVVGDRAKEEIAIAKSLGARAIWLKSGKFQDELPLPYLPLPDETISDITAILNSSIIQN